MDLVLLSAVVRGFTAAGAVALYVWCIRPALVWHRARRAAFVAAGAAALAPAVLLLVAGFVAVPLYVVLAAYALLVLAWSWPRALVVATGGARELPRPIEGLWAGSARILEHLDLGAVDEAEREARAIEAHRSPETERSIELWQRRIDEERQRRRGVRVSSRPTMGEIRGEWERLLDSGSLLRGTRRVAIVGLAGIIGIGTALVDGRACIGVERLILTAPGSPPGGTLPLARAIAGELERGSTRLFDEPMDLARAAESRHDPTTLDHLVEAGFAAAHARGWTASDGRRIQADVFEFEDQAGAVRFQHAVNRYACRFANEAFEGPMGGIGLQVRRSNGDPIEEQVSWVVGSRRHLVSVRAMAPPEDHARVIGLVEATEKASLR